MASIRFWRFLDWIEPRFDRLDAALHELRTLITTQGAQLMAADAEIHALLDQISNRQGFDARVQSEPVKGVLDAPQARQRGSDAITVNDACERRCVSLTSRDSRRDGTRNLGGKHVAAADSNAETHAANVSDRA